MSRDIKAGGAYVELLLKSQAFVAGLRNASARLRSFGDNAKRIGSLGFLGGGGGDGLFAAFAGAGAATALAYPVKLAANLEVAQAQFESLTGSAEKARQILQEIEEFSSISLIPVEELQRSSQLLLGYGLAADKVIPSVRALAEISRGNAERFNLLALAFGQTTAKTRLYAAEVRQFVESGWNPLQTIAEKTGETMQQVSKRLEAGGISASELTEALQAAVGVGGRFNGLLAAIGKTATGAFSRLLTGLKLAIRPLGEELLPAIKGVLGTAIEWLPTFSKVVKSNAALYVSVVGVAIGLTAGASALISFGIAAKVAAFGLAGVATAISLLLSPITLVTGVIAGLGYWFMKSTKWGRTMVASLAGWFGQLREIAAQAFGGIADALASGEIALAGRIALAALRAAWLQGTDQIRKDWAGFKDFFVRSVLNMTHDALIAFTKFAYGLEAIFAGIKGAAKNTFIDAVNWLLKIGKTEQQQTAFDILAGAAKRGNDKNTANEIMDIMKEREAALNMFEMGKEADNRILDDKFTAERKKIDDDLAAAKAELARAKEEARIAREGGLNPQLGPGVKFDPAAMPSASAMKNEIFGSFNGAALRAQGGANGNVQDKMLDQLKQGNKKTDKLIDAVQKGRVFV